METLCTDVAVVGAGPIGLELAVALKRAGLDYQVFDAKQIGYTVSWFAPATRFFSSNERISIAGVPLHTPDQGKATREDYLSYLRGVVEQFDLKVDTYEPVVGIERREGEFFLTTRRRGGQRGCRAKRVVLATGGTDRPRRLGIVGEDLPHVSQYFRDPHLYFRKKLLIVGGKNSAVEAALRCHHAGAQVSICYRRAELSAKSIKYWLLPEINDLIRSGRIRGYFNMTAAEITDTQVKLVSSMGNAEGAGFGVRGSGNEGKTEGDSAPIPPVGSQVQRPDLPSSPNPEPQTPNPSLLLDFDFVLLLIGYEQDVALLRLAGVDVGGECQAPVFDERTMETNVPGLYVAGTAVAGTQDKYRVFIENCHVHVDRIIAALTGAAAVPRPGEQIVLPES